MLVFVEGGKPENLEKNLQSNARTKIKLKPHMAGIKPRALTTVSFLLDLSHVGGLSNIPDP